jgi:hypothetical protein
MQLWAPAGNIKGVDGMGTEDLDALFHHFRRHCLSPLRAGFHVAMPAFQIAPVADVDLEHIEAFRPHPA